MARKISNTDRHIRWNWETAEEGKVRYHFVVVDDKNRNVLIDRILEQMREFGFVESVRRCEGKVKDSKLRYLFDSYDSDVSPTNINLSRLRKPVKRDFDLKERQRGSIEDYVFNTYER
ncbi:MAG: hypothetical protein Q7R52_00580 [archaeon]|nr:hypothetical protein [archaeon]